MFGIKHLFPGGKNYLHWIMLHLQKSLLMSINQQSVMNYATFYQQRTCKLRTEVCLPLNILLMMMGLSP